MMVKAKGEWKTILMNIFIFYRVYYYYYYYYYFYILYICNCERYGDIASPISYNLKRKSTKVSPSEKRKGIKDLELVKDIFFLIIQINSIQNKPEKFFTNFIFFTYYQEGRDVETI